MNYYNENDPFAAAWLRNLITAGHVSAGDVDGRSIEDVKPDDLKRYKQCHFFAGVGVWSYALRLAGWPDNREVWTGSCPCQPFSGAGAQVGFADVRHLWPAWFWLIGQRKPRAIFGEQTASNHGRAWIDFVSIDLERMGYAVGAVDFCAASVGAPHIRQRLYFVADGSRLRGSANTGGLANNNNKGCAEFSATRLHDQGPSGRNVAGRGTPDSGRLGDASQHGAGEHTKELFGNESQHAQRPAHGDNAPDHPGEVGYWSDCEWLPCLDGKARPVEPGTFPLAHGAPARVGRLRGYGNSIVAPQAAAFISAAMECLP